MNSNHLPNNNLLPHNNRVPDKKLPEISRPPMRVLPIRVLVVDDMPGVRKDLISLLVLAGNACGVEIEVVGEAGEGLTAIRLVDQLHPQVVLMDLAMPVMDGYAATREIKAHHPTCRVIALSVHSYSTARQAAAQAGVDAFVEKGAPIHELIRAIRAVPGAPIHLPPPPGAG